METVRSRSNKNIFIGTILGYVNLILSVISGFVFIPWMISSVGSDNYGLYTLSNSLITLFLFDFGMSTTINTFLSKMRAKGDKEGINNFLAAIYKIYIVIDLVLLAVFATLFFCIDFMYAGLTPTEKSSFKVIFLITAAFNLISFPTSSFNGVIQAYEQFGLLKIIELANRVFYIVFSFVCLKFNLGLYALVAANCLSGLICIVLKFIVLKSKIKTKPNFKFKINKEYLKDVLMFSLWAAIQALASRLVFNVMPSILGIVSNSDNITLFSVGASLEGYVYSFSAIMNGFFLPKLARIKEQYKNDPETCKKEISSLASIIGKIQLLIIGLIFIGFASIGQKFINYWMKDSDLDYTVTFYGTLLIISTQLVFVPELIFYTQMFMEKRYIKHLAICSISKAAINVVLSFCFGYFYGALGAYISVFIARLFEVIYQNVLYKKYLDADLGYFFKKVYLKQIIPLFLAFGYSMLVNSIALSTVSYMNIAKAIILITSAYLVFYIAFLDKKDSDFLTSIIRRRL